MPHDWQPIETAPKYPRDKDGKGPLVMLRNYRGEMTAYWQHWPDRNVKGWWVDPETVPSFVKDPTHWKAVKS